ncbi:hypothetical protein CR513_59101, partial [Mucuna pruriens]
MAKITTIRFLLAMATICHWSLYQLDIKNAFLHGDLDEEIYMEQPLGFVAQGESGLSPRAWFGMFSQVIQNFGMTRRQLDHSVFYCHSSFGKCVYLIVYVDDIVITGNDNIKISPLKQYLFNHFETKDLGHLKYFLGIKVAQSKEGIVISQRKYVLNILQETNMSNCMPIDNPMDPNMKLMVKYGEPYSDRERYRRLVGKLIYLTITRPDISFAVGVVSQFMQAPCVDHWAAVLCILRYIKKTPGQGLVYMRIRETPIYQVIVMLIGQDLPLIDDLLQVIAYLLGEMWSLGKVRSKVLLLAHSSAEAEYRAMTLATCELIWVKQLIQKLKFVDVQPMKLYCDNQAALYIASNLVFHERTKHIEIDCRTREVIDQRNKYKICQLESSLDREHGYH